MCKVIRATATVEYKLEDVMNDFAEDYPDEKFTEQDARDMIYKWIKDDFENTLAEVRIEEING